MENEEYTEFKLDYTNKLNDMRDKFVIISETIIRYSELNEATYFLSLVNKAIELIDGFIDLLINKNLTCLSLILRVQLDNCMRTYAGYIVEDKALYFSEFQKLNSRLNKIKDINGKKLTDANLRKYLNQFDKSFGDTYAKASKFVHHTDSSLVSMMRINEKNEIEYVIGSTHNEFTTALMFSLAKSFNYFLEMHYQLIVEIYRLKETSKIPNSIS